MRSEIYELKKRSDFWKETIAAAPLVYAHVYFDERRLPLFVNKDVLEIGAGDGAQYARVKTVCRSYALADIALDIMARPVFANVTTKLHLENYAQDFKLRFDIIHFWRVMHHVLPDEVRDFAKWLHCHVRETGLVCFDLPLSTHSRDTYGYDGTVTVPHTLESITTAFKPFFEPTAETDPTETPFY